MGIGQMRTQIVKDDLSVYFIRCGRGQHEWGSEREQGKTRT